jgi:spore maturation protein CgeB
MGETFQPELVFVFKGVMVRPETLVALRAGGARLFIFYPDWDFGEFYHQFNNDFLDCMRLYDVLFTPKSYNIERFQENAVRRVEFLPYAFDPWCHYPVGVSGQEQTRYQTDIAFIGSWGRSRTELLESLVESKFPYRLSIWGNNWQRLDPVSPLRKYCRFVPAYGETQAKILACSKIALAFLRPPDLHTARTFEIPAQGAFMLAERSSEHIQFFQDGIEIACFSDVSELREKIDYYLHHDSDRQQIAQAGYLHVTQGGHSYVDRMRQVLQIYHEM